MCVCARVCADNMTKVKKKGREGKDALIDDIREELENYKHVFVFCVHNMRTQKMNQIREKFGDSRFDVCFGASLAVRGRCA